MAPAAKTPNIYVPPPDEANLPPMEAQPPASVTDAKPVVAEEAKPKKKPRKQPNATQPPAPTAAASTAPPATPAVETPVAETAKLGALGSGSDASPGQQRDVAEKIFAVEKRLSDLPASVQEREQKQIAKVRLFLKEASDALKGGDVDGARILTTKADLLVDDVQK